MDAKDVKNSLDKAVVVEGQGNGMITGYIKGWVEVQLANETMIKVRAKDLILLPEQDTEPLATEDVGEIEDFDPEDLGPVDPNAEGGVFDISCPACKHTWPTVKRENYICPSCKHMFCIRLHPKKTNYVIGLDATASGRDTMDINDEIANLLRGKPIEDVYQKVASELMQLPKGTWFSKANVKEFGMFSSSDYDPNVLLDAEEFLVAFLFNKFGHLNLGMQRMNLGNTLRGAFKRSVENVTKGVGKKVADA